MTILFLVISDVWLNTLLPYCDLLLAFISHVVWCFVNVIHSFIEDSIVKPVSGTLDLIFRLCTWLGQSLRMLCQSQLFFRIICHNIYTSQKNFYMCFSITVVCFLLGVRTSLRGVPQPIYPLHVAHQHLTLQLPHIGRNFPQRVNCALEKGCLKRNGQKSNSLMQYKFTWWILSQILVWNPHIFRGITHLDYVCNLRPSISYIMDLQI